MVIKNYNLQRYLWFHGTNEVVWKKRQVHMTWREAVAKLKILN